MIPPDPAPGPSIVLLGPQRRPTVDAVVHAVAPGSSPIGIITAGWQEREPDDAEFDAALDGRGLNLRLYARWQDVLALDPVYAEAERKLHTELAERKELYGVQLAGVLGALRNTAHYGGGRVQVRDQAIADAQAAVRLVDERHLSRQREVLAEFEARWQPGERPAIAGHRAAVAQLLGRVRVLAVAGGHVGVLVHVLRLFAVTKPALVIAWSAGAMALTERVLLFNDRAPHGSADAEFACTGLSWLPGCVLLPHARRRLRTDDPARMAELTVRAAPASCVVLDDGTRLDLPPDGELPATARVVGTDGRISELAVRAG